ncbi:MAG: thioredoxin [Deltaproteobacteria bacterium]|nr:MAG: thioredoxin [Deltaproteobacteria bacterium]
MSFLTILAFSLAAVLAGFIALQLFMVRRMRRLRGQQAPRLDGAAGRRVADGRMALFYFYSPQCGACRSMTPVVRELAERVPGVFLVDVSQDLETARRFKVMATPTTILVRDGKVAEVLVGARSADTLRGLVGG